jgi:hypothetical protein
MKKRYKYKIKVAPPGAYIETTFTYKELALFALLIWKWRGLGYMEDEEIMKEAGNHINGLLDQIDEDGESGRTCAE